MLLNRRVHDLEAKGFSVYIEGENWFEVSGKNHAVKVAGKPDILAIDGSQAFIEDCKTGKKKNSDLYQVLIYMLLLPVSTARCRGLSLEGRLVYRNEVINIHSSLIDVEFKKRFREEIAIISSPSAARKVPSLQECRRCDIPARCCPERIDQTYSEVIRNHDFF